MTDNEILKQLSAPFHPSRITWKPQTITKDKGRALAVAYADLRAYQDRLDDVCGLDWSVSYTPWGDRIICHVTIKGVTRSSTGEADARAEKNDIGGTAAEAQAMKRACAMFGLGRYLYNLPDMWVEYDGDNSRFTDKAMARLNGMISQHYMRHLDGRMDEIPAVEPKSDGGITQPIDPTLDGLGKELYGEQWPTVLQHNIKRLTGSDTVSLTADQVGKLVAGLQKLKAQRLQTA